MMSSPLNKQLFRATVPMLFGMIAIMSCQLVDSAFIGQLGSAPLAALGFSLPIYQLVIGVQVGLGIATTAIIATALGAKSTDYAKQLGSLVLLMGFVLILVLCLLLWANQNVIALTLGADQQLLPFINAYWVPWLLSCWLGAMLYFGYSIFRAHGQTGLPGKVMVLTSVINIVLDPVFIFYFEWGLAGAAWATCVAFAVGCLIILYQLVRQQLVKMPHQYSVIMKGMKQLTAFASSSMMSQFLPPIAAMLATIVVASYGESAIAAWGLGSRVELFSILVVLSLTMAMPPIIGRLRGGNHIDEIHQLVKASVLFVMLWQLLVAAFLALGANVLSRVFTTDQSIADIFSVYLWWVPLSFGGLGVCMLMVSVCSALGMPKVSLLISTVRLFACYLPILWIGSELAGIDGIFIGVVLGNLLAGYFSWEIYKRQLASLRPKETSSLVNEFCPS